MPRVAGKEAFFSVTMNNMRQSSTRRSALPPGTGVQSGNYWTSTTHAHYTSHAWYLDLSLGGVNYHDKVVSIYVWPVRGGQ